MNYDKICDQIIEQIKKEEKPKLLLHACCAPCSSAVLERLSSFFDITILFYNPNITDSKEYQKRKQELERFLKEVNYNIKLFPCSYEKEEFLKSTKGFEKEKEGGKRCYLCYQLRLNKTAEIAKKHHFDYFTTTLSISPHKNAKWLNEIGKTLEDEYKVSYLYSDFKKKEGYKRSIILARKYNLYRQNYCGCIYSKIEKHLNFDSKKSETTISFIL